MAKTYILDSKNFSFSDHARNDLAGIADIVASPKDAEPEQEPAEEPAEAQPVFVELDPNVPSIN